MKDHWDRIITSTPVNAQAAKQLCGGENWTPRVQILDYSTEMPAVFPVEHSAKWNPSFTDFTGKTLGRLTVLGRSAPSGGKWVCRCKCGYYCTRQNKTLARIASGEIQNNAMRGVCNYQRSLREGQRPGMKNYKPVGDA